VTEFRSYIDGLKEWSRFVSVGHSSETNEESLIKKVTFSVESRDEVVWAQGDAEMKLTSDWNTEREKSPDSPWKISEWTVLESKFDEPRPIEDHIAEHRKVADLLTISSGLRMRFRKHKVRDETFAQKYNQGVHYPFVEMISRRTVRDYSEPHPTKDELRDWLFYLPQVGAAGLAQWSASYKQWERVILPTTGALARRNLFAEDTILSTTMSLEAAGYIIGPREGESEATGHADKGRPSTTLCVYRILDLLDLGWGSRIDSIAGLAHAIGSTYNDIKHYREDLPDQPRLFIISEITEHVVRLLLTHLVDVNHTLLTEYREKGAMWRIEELLERFELRIDAEGSFVTAPTLEKPDTSMGGYTTH
jgi:hypothetical protein